MEQEVTIAEVIQFASQVNQGVEQLTEGIDPQDVQQLEDLITAQLFAQFTEMVEAAPSGTQLGVEDFAKLVPDTVSTAIIAGTLIASGNHPTQVNSPLATLKEGRPIQIIFNL